MKKNLYCVIHNIESINSLLKKNSLFLIIIGGVASGKSYVYEKYFSTLPLVDIDEFTFNLSGGDWEKARNKTSKAIKLVENKLLEYFKSQKSVVNTCTGASLPGVQKKLKLASDYKMTTIIILVDVPIDLALERNQIRAIKGNRNLIPEYKVHRTNISARENFKIFSKIADYSFILGEK